MEYGILYSTVGYGLIQLNIMLRYIIKVLTMVLKHVRCQNMCNLHISGPRMLHSHNSICPAPISDPLLDMVQRSHLKYKLVYGRLMLLDYRLKILKQTWGPCTGFMIKLKSEYIFFSIQICC